MAARETRPNYCCLTRQVRRLGEVLRDAPRLSRQKSFQSAWVTHIAAFYPTWPLHRRGCVAAGCRAS